MTVLVAALLTLLGSCGIPGDPGQTFVAIDWVYAPQALNFPEFPAIVVTGDYVEHQTGSYFAEYIAWDGTYWNASYNVVVEGGAPAPLLGVGDHGDDYFFSIWLYSFGPSMYQDDHIVRSVLDAPSVKTRPVPVGETDAILAARAAAAAREAGGEHPITVKILHREGPATIQITARGWEPIRDRPFADSSCSGRRLPDGGPRSGCGS